LIVTAVEPRTAQQLKVYPNPASEELVVALNGFEINKAVVITMVDLLGREFHHTMGNGGEEVHIDIRNYQAGQYVLLLTQGRTRITKSFIKSF
jgi:Secretion system C-terminal sorting domain